MKLSRKAKVFITIASVLVCALWGLVFYGKSLDNEVKTVQVSSEKSIAYPITIEEEIECSFKNEEEKAVSDATMAEYRKGLNCYDRDDYECAVMHFHNAITIFPQSSLVHIALGNSYAMLGKFVLAQAEYLKAHDKTDDPKNKKDAIRSINFLISIWDKINADS